MAKGVKIDNKKIQQVMASYALTNSYNATSKECNVSDKTVKKIIEEHSEEFVKVSERKKTQFVEYADKLIDKAMKKLDEALDRKNIPINNLTTAIGTLYDKRALAKGESTSNNSITINMSEEVRELSK